MKRLYRSRRDKVIAGVAGGIAEYFEVDPTLVRLAWVAAGLSGFGIIVYIIAAIIVPENPAEYAAPPRAAQSSEYQSAANTGESQAEGDLPHLPEDEQGPVAPPSGGSAAGARSFGYILVAVGLFLMARRFVPWFDMDRLWPVVLILIGAYLVAGGARSGK